MKNTDFYKYLEALKPFEQMFGSNITSIPFDKYRHTFVDINRKTSLPSKPMTVKQITTFFKKKVEQNV